MVDDDEARTFGDLLRHHRESANLTQEDLAERSVVSVHAISMLERGVRRTPRSSTIESLAEALTLTAAQRSALISAARRRTTPLNPSARPAELPHDLADHIGRVDEIEASCAVLAGGDHPGGLVTVVGMGGIGKTSFAVHVAHRVSFDYPDGVLYMDLKGADPTPLDPGTLLIRLLRTLGVHPSDIPVEVDRRSALLRTTTAPARHLFVFDNARDAAQVRPLLPGSRRCGVLVTSRDRLVALDANHRVDLRPLDEPDSRAVLAAVVGDDRLTDEDATRELIGRCAGHPLALRIAACRLASRPTHSVRSLVDRLGHGSTLLGELTAGDLAVRPTFESGFAVLRDDDAVAARLFAAWGVWAGGDLGSCAVSALLDASARDTERALDRLIDGHLLETPFTDAYRLHDLLRSYSRERSRLDLTTDEREAALDRLIAWYLCTADRATIVLAPYHRRIPHDDIPPPGGIPEFADATAALHWCDRERTNLVAAVVQASQAGLDRAAWLLGTLLMPYFEQRMLWPEWIETHHIAWASARRLGDVNGAARAMAGLAAAYRRSGDPERAVVIAGEGIELYRQLGAHEMAANLMDTIARAQYDLGRPDQAAATLEAICDDATVGAFRRATSLSHLGMIKRLVGALDEAVAVSQRAVRLARTTASPYAVIPALQSLGMAYAARGDLDSAADALTECVAQCRTVDAHAHEAEVHSALATIALARGDHARGVDHLSRSVRLMAALGHPDEQATRQRLVAAQAG